ncbi:hypothetical protein [Pelagibacterium xiamenense]|uniref:hypothetical protein n=1 Tax=Pelagibacterium xiamenense TaxID=2901140 RepID=UPI001E648943|nr:hypothetical protein [Pelagibacterium xiamenense]MCD7058917.1 hypothetical protein [Pelagibacterium xiamenense]
MGIQSKVLALSVAFLVGSTASVPAQVTATPDLSGIDAGCISASATVGLCTGATEAYASGVSSLPTGEADSELVNAAVFIAERLLAGPCTPPNPIEVAGLTVLADAISDPALAQQVRELIDTVAACGEIPVAAIGTQRFASDN